MPENRGHKRYNIRIYGVFSKDIDLEQTDMMLANLGIGGAFIKTDKPAVPGTSVTLRFYLPGRDIPVSVSGEVAWWQTDPAKGSVGMGVKFTAVQEADLEAIKKYIEGLVAADLFGE